MDTIQNINLIATNPDIRGGRPCIAGTGLRVTDVVMAHLFHNRTPSELASDYGVTLGQIHAALAFYYEHKAALDEDIRHQVNTTRKYREQNYGKK